MITISACLIVKNEEALLARCLESLRGLVDEIVIVDTGSDDRTKEIAAAYTTRVYDFVWQDDFSAARNFSFSLATMDYIYTADADEVIDEENRRRFLQLKQVLPLEIEIVQMYYANQLAYNTTYNFDKEYRPKLFKRLREFIWEEPIHETVRLNPVIYDSEIEILHKPAGNHAPRDFRIFQKVLKRQPRLSNKLNMMYARELMIAGTEEDFLAARPYFEKLEISEQDEARLKQIHCVLARSYHLALRQALTREQTAEQLSLMECFYRVCMRNIACDKSSSEVCYELGTYYKESGSIEEAILWLLNAVYETEPELCAEYGAKRAYQALAECYALSGDNEKAEKFLGLAVEG